jgi:WD40 repeat protein
VLTGGFGQALQLWDATSGKTVGPRVPCAADIYTAAVSPDQRTFVVGYADRTARLYEAATGKRLVPPMEHGSADPTVAFSPDGRMIVTTTWAAAMAWETATGNLLPQLFTHQNSGITALAFSPDGKLLLTGGREDKTARLWNSATGESFGSPLCHAAAIWAAAFSPDGKRVLTGSLDATAHLWDVESGKELGPAMTHPWPICRVAFSPDGTLLLTATTSGTVRLWDGATCKPVTPLLVHSPGHAMSVKAVAFCTDGRTFWTAGWDKALRRWEIPTAAEGSLGHLLLQTEVLTRMELDRDGQVHVLDGKSWHERRQRLAKFGGPPMAGR